MQIDLNLQLQGQFRRMDGIRKIIRIIEKF